MLDEIQPLKMISMSLWLNSLDTIIWCEIKQK